MMQIKTTRQVNAHTWDGRAVSAGDGDVLEIDDDDAGMVGLAKSLIMSGQAEHYGDAGTANDVAGDEPADEPTEDPAGEEMDPEAEPGGDESP